MLNQWKPGKSGDLATQKTPVLAPNVSQVSDVSDQRHPCYFCLDTRHFVWLVPLNTVSFWSFHQCGDCTTLYLTDHEKRKGQEWGQLKENWHRVKHSRLKPTTQRGENFPAGKRYIESYSTLDILPFVSFLRYRDVTLSSHRTQLYKMLWPLKQWHFKVFLSCSLVHRGQVLARDYQS